MDKRKDKRTIIIILLLILNLCISAGIISHLSHDGGGTEKYTLYIGTNDKDTYTQLISTDEARDIVNGICMEHTGGYTQTDARGCWVDETGTATKEDTLVYSFTGISEEDLQAIMDDVLKALHQNSILVEHEEVTSTFYDGK